MIPTNFLRQVPIGHGEPDYDDCGMHRGRAKFVVTGYRLQQWHSSDGSGPDAQRDVEITDGTGEGGK